MKKVIALMLVLLCVCTMVFAGGSKESSGGKTQIVFWHRTSDDFTKEVAAFEAANPDIDVVAEAVGSDYDDLYMKYMTAIASRSLPNVGIVGQRHGIPQMYESGQLLPIEEYLDEETLSDVMPSYWGRFIYDGKRICIPYSSSVPVLYYNADLFAEHGIEPPAKFADVPAAAKALTLDTNGDGKTDIYGFNFNSDTPWYIQAWAWDYGSKVIISDSEASVDNEGYQKVLEAIHQMVHVDHSMPANQHNTGLDDFTNGYSAMFVTSSANLKQFMEGCKFTLGVAPLPGAYTILGGNSLGLFASSDEAKMEASIRFINYLITLEGSLTNIEKGYLPIRTSFIVTPEINALLEKEPLRQVSIDSVSKLFDQGVNVADSTIWLTTMDVLSQVEADPNADIPALLDGFQATVDEFYEDYFGN